MATDLLSIAYFGKIPTHGDFVRHHASSAAWRVLDEWVQKGLYEAKYRLGPRLPAVYAEADTFGFLFDAASGVPPLAGVWQPSRDRVGRTYPFIVAFEVDTEWHRPEDVPLRYASFFDQASELARQAADGAYEPVRLPDLADQLSGAGNGVASGYDRFLQETRLTVFWERLWGYPDDTRKYLLFKNLLDIVVPVGQNGLPPSFPLILRFPLSAETVQGGFEARFWIDVTTRLLGSEQATPSFFWSLPGGKSTSSPLLLLALRAPTPALLQHLLAVDVESDTLCILENLGDQSAALAALSIPPHIGQMLEDEVLTLRDFINKL